MVTIPSYRKWLAPYSIIILGEGETLMNGSARAPSPGYLSPESSSCYRSVAARTAAEELCLSCICVGIVLGLGHTKEEREIDR